MTVLWKCTVRPNEVLSSMGIHGELAMNSFSCLQQQKINLLSKNGHCCFVVGKGRLDSISESILPCVVGCGHRLWSNNTYAK